MLDHSNDLDPELQRALGDLKDREPTHDLWPAIAPRLRPRLPRGTLLLRWPSALAAGLVVAVASAGATYLVLNRATPLPDVATTLERSALTVPATPPTPAALSEPADNALVLAIGDLEHLVATTRSALDPATRSSLARTMATLDAAIAEATAAKANDPESSWAARYLTSTLRKKFEMLQSIIVRSGTTS